MLLAMLGTLAMAGDGDPRWKTPGWGFGGLPAVNYNSDEGLGLGALATVYRYDGKTSPYKLSTTLLLFATTKGIHNHRLEVDALKLAGGRLRLTGRIWADFTAVNNFCGLGPDVTCDPAVAEAEAARRGLEGEAAEQFVRRYYQSAYLRPNFNLVGRYRVGDLDQDTKLEVFSGLRLAYHQPGTLKEEDPDPGNLISQRIAAGGAEEGFLSQVQVGVMVDSRDFEPAPSRGIWAEASVRGAHSVIGSQFDVFGYNLTLRGYVPILPDSRLVFASRGVFDGLFGDVPIREMSELGGATVYNFGGGLNSGRGIRQRRYIGRVKTMLQNELRWRFWHVEPFNVGVDFTLVGFSDVLAVAESHSTLGDLANPHAGQGAGLRLAFEENFIVRFDVGFSAVEDYSPSVYIDINNLF